MNFLRSLSTEKIVVGCILVCAAFFFFWNIPNTVQFQGDQGRDALIVSQIFRERDFVFIGPVTSVGNMYLGPLYYYFMLPFLMISYPSPLGPVYAIGVLALITLFLLYKTGTELFSKKTAFIALVLYAFSSIAVTYARFSWNPNPAPLVSLVMMVFTYLAWVKHPKYWLGVAISFSILLQLHYLTLLSLGGAGIIWLLSLRDAYISEYKVERLKKIFLYSLLSFGIVVISLTPLILFDVKHDFLNAKAFTSLFTKESVFTGETEYSFPQKIAQTVKDMEGRALQILYEQLIAENLERNRVILLIEVIGIALLYKRLKDSEKKALIVLLAYTLTAIIGAAVYKSNIFNHYIIYTLPAVVLIHGLLLSKLKPTFIVHSTLILSGIVYAYTNIQRMPLQTIGWTIYDIRDVAKTIHDRVAEGEKYNIVLLSETGDIDGQNYRYFLSTTKKPPLPIEKRGETETLFIINEDKKLKKVTDSPIYEIVVFPDKEPKEVYTITDGPEITVLRK